MGDHPLELVVLGFIDLSFVRKEGTFVILVYVGCSFLCSG